MESSSESPFPTKSTTGNETRSSVSWLSNSKPVSGLHSSRRSRAGWPSQATNALRTAMGVFCWGRRPDFEASEEKAREHQATGESRQPVIPTTGKQDKDIC